MYAVGAGSARPRIAYTPLLGRADPAPTMDVSLIDAFPLMLCQNAALPYFRRGLRGLHGSIFLLYPLKGMINPRNPRNPRLNLFSAHRPTAIVLLISNSRYITRLFCSLGSGTEQTLFQNPVNGLEE